MTEQFDLVQSDALEGVPHGFFGHGKGRHQFGFGGPGDEVAVRHVRGLASQAILAGSSLVAPHQTHSPDVITVKGVWRDDAAGRPQGDGLVTSTGGLALGIVTADCGPVLFADKDAGVIGAAHAGWRGAHGGILENTLDAMEALGAKRESVVAAIGPTIAQPSYEVDTAFRANFTCDDDVFFSPGREGHWQFDLPAYIAARLTAAGAGVIDNLALDTYALEDRYYSYRRAVQHGAPDYGRQLSMIALP